MGDSDGDSDFEIFDDVSTKAINDEVSRCLDDAVVTLGVQALSVNEEDGGGKEESKSTATAAGGGKKKLEGNVEAVSPKIKVHEFTETVVDLVISGQLMVLDQSCYVWLGLEGGSARQGAFVTAVKTKYEQIPIVSLLATGQGEQFSPGIAQRLSKRSGMAVYACCDLPDEAMDVLPVVEAKIVAILSTM